MWKTLTSKISLLVFKLFGILKNILILRDSTGRINTCVELLEADVLGVCYIVSAEKIFL